MAEVHLSGSVWSRGGASIFILLVTCVETRCGFYIESDDSELIVNLDCSKQRGNDLRRLTQKYGKRLTEIDEKNWERDGEIDEVFDTAIADSKIGLRRLESFFADSCSDQLHDIWEQLTAKPQTSEAASSNYQIKTNHTLLGIW